MSRDPSYQPISADDSWVAGEDQTFEFTAYDKTGAIVDITDWSLQFKMATTKGGVTVLSMFGNVTSGSAGKFQLFSPAGDTTALGITADTVYHYEIRRIDLESNARIAWGPAVLQAAIT